MINKLKTGLLLCLSFFALNGKAQFIIENPVSWTTSVMDLGNGEYQLSAKVKIDGNWHIYATGLPEDGPVSTEFVFDGSQGNFKQLGKISEPEPKEFYDPNFRMTIRWHNSGAMFLQKIKLLKPTQRIRAEVTYMACDDSSCMPPETEELFFNIPPPSNPLETYSNNTAKNSPPLERYRDNDGMDGDKEAGEQIQTEERAEDSIISSEAADTIHSDKNIIEATSENKKAESHSLWTTFLFAFAAGFLALLTPCVFPMIPMTVSFFIKRNEKRTKGIKDAALYGLSIIVIYLTLGVGVSAIFGASALNALSTNPWFNLFFFALLLVFALSFFGAFELTLPSSWINTMDSKSNKDGLTGIFFMAFTLALVSFSCTGPFVGTVLVEAAAKGNFWGPVVGMFGFSLALALPFTLFALFPNWLKSLPKSGGWLSTVKAVLGFIELAFALKFLSNADLVWDLHLLQREVFIALWVVIFAILGFYLLGKIRLPNDDPKEKTSVTGLVLAVISFSFAIYMLPGVWGAPVKIISAFVPPTNYAEIKKAAPIGETSATLPLGGSFGSAPSFMSAEQSDYGRYMHSGPHGIPAFTDYNKARQYAIKANKPMLLDFTGKACVNCRKMESDVWSDEKVMSMLGSDYVLVELFVDFRAKLPENERFVNSKGRKITTVGQKWSDFQISRFGRNSQPFYVAVDPENEKQIGESRTYDTDVEAYTEWLKKNLSLYKK